MTRRGSGYAVRSLQRLIAGVALVIALVSVLQQALIGDWVFVGGAILIAIAFVLFGRLWDAHPEWRTRTRNGHAPADSFRDLFLPRLQPTDPAFVRLALPFGAAFTAALYATGLIADTNLGTTP